MFFETDELIIDEIKENDSKRFYEICNQNFVLKWMKDWEHNLEEIKELINYFVIGYEIRNPYTHPFCLAIRIKTTQELIGICGFGTKEELDNEVEICYFIDEKYSNKGYMGQVVKNAIEIYFKMVDKDYLYALVDDENINSIKILMKNGFKKIEQNNRIKKSYYKLSKK